MTPLLTYCAPLALLREYFSELVRRNALLLPTTQIDAAPTRRSATTGSLIMIHLQSDCGTNLVIPLSVFFLAFILL